MHERHCARACRPQPALMTLMTEGYPSLCPVVSYEVNDDQACEEKDREEKEVYYL